MNVLVRKAGTTDVSVVIRIVDAVDGTPETGVTHATSGLSVQYRREGAALAGTLFGSTLSALTDAHTDNAGKHIADGYYRIDLPDAACAAGVTGVLVTGTATGMVVMGCYIQLVAYDPFDTVRLGLTALPNAAADAAGGLPISDAGGLDLDALNTNVSTVLALDVVRSNTMQAGSTSTTAVLDAAASATNDFYNGMIIKTTGGTGSGQYRAIGSASGSYNGTTKVATIDGTWTTTPDVTTTFDILGAPPAPASVSAVLAAGEVTLITADIDANSTEIAAIKAVTDDITFTTANQVDVQVLSMAANSLTGTAMDATAKAAVNAEVVDALNVDTYAEPGQEAPGATVSLAKKIGYLYKAFRNRVTQTATEMKLYADNGSTVDQKATVSDDTTTFDRGELGSGP